MGFPTEETHPLEAGAPSGAGRWAEGTSLAWDGGRPGALASPRSPPWKDGAAPLRPTSARRRAGVAEAVGAREGAQEGSWTERPARDPLPPALGAGGCWQELRSKAAWNCRQAMSSGEPLPQTLPLARQLKLPPPPQGPPASCVHPKRRHSLSSVLGEPTGRHRSHFLLSSQQKRGERGRVGLLPQFPHCSSGGAGLSLLLLLAPPLPQSYRLSIFRWGPGFQPPDLVTIANFIPCK